eukprot:CAMPEP_0116938130 /NCGR_PEP_ID=MMETSP0467-20121206/31927_1 /TAXON_ID=283647 /ORGANISM="Mesodinium pulex, Strain SPMC105" /LENGTH=56 /DNA_ID=CAMNT_0004620099 /DNA_START=826 /DNA_END=999 /DNA_ORIENTATION=+
MDNGRERELDSELTKDKLNINLSPLETDRNTHTESIGIEIDVDNTDGVDENIQIES